MASRVYDSLFVVARAHAVTVDAVVAAALGRGGPSAAYEAARRLSADNPTFFSGLESWPWTCQFCSREVAAVGSCHECGTRSCAVCLGRHGCPPCTKKAEAAVERRRLISAEQEGHRKWLQRQLAKPLPAPPPPAAPDEMPPPPPPPVMRPEDPVYPEEPPRYIATPGGVLRQDVSHAEQLDQSATPPSTEAVG
jgi:hypothetical protein